MASTNKTSNYELSQFVGSDKPAWLSDYNGDMNKIDSGIHSAQTTATGADGKADANATNIGNLGYLSTTNKTDIVSAINEVDGNADTAANTASAAATAANAANAGLQKFNLTNRITLSPTSDKGTLNTSITNVQYAGDSTASVFKVYGRAYVQNLANISATMHVKIGDTPLRPTTSYVINTAALVTRVFAGTGHTDTVPRNITINTDGSITYEDTLVGNISEVSIMLPPCLYFNSDFGDE